MEENNVTVNNEAVQESQEASGGINEAQTNPAAQGEKKKDGTFTQAQVNRMMAKEKGQGRAAAYREMGIDPEDPNAKSMMEMFKAFMASMKTPEQQAQSMEAQHKIELAAAESRLKKAEAKAEAMQLGLRGEYVEDAVTIILAKLDDSTDIKTAVGELKTKYPTWFGVSGQNADEVKGEAKQTGKDGTGSSVGNVGAKAGNISGIGARLAAQRKAAAPKKSFWA